MGKIIKNGIEYGGGNGGNSSEIINEYLNGKKQRFLTQAEYDALTDEEKADTNTVYLITDYTGNTVVSEPTLRTRLAVELGSCDYQTGEDVEDTKKARSKDYIPVNGTTMSFDYNGFWGLVRCYDNDKTFLGTGEAAGGYELQTNATGLFDCGTVTLLENTAYVRFVFGNDYKASTDMTAGQATGWDIKFGDTVYNTICY